MHADQLDAALAAHELYTDSERYLADCYERDGGVQCTDLDRMADDGCPNVD